MYLQLDDLTALVTGGTKGIGRAIVEQLLEEGCNVSYCARSVQKDGIAPHTTESGKARAIGTALDVADKAAMEAWVQDTAEIFGGVDIVISNVSALGIPSTPENWQASFNVDMMAFVNLVEASLPYLRKSKAAAIVSVSSVSGREIDFTAAGPYGAFKAAVTHYTQQLAYTLAPEGIRSNSVSPGNTFFEGSVWDDAQRNNPELYEKALALNPMKRMATPEEVAKAVVFLASPASSFTSGTNLVVDGALTRGVQL
ncbi:dehydrogenase/reductase SDR family protein member 10 [Gloeophyllum trabeum ATCC 11539]|uniref:Dehydrogenase/reductase SDR family protein member 10 n=1 Tax=Gloeophyllum trabeum (strain ATCC 11539 / FP-39264 / Madison 617) TaxID=670483 RepID=S7QL93_GLOTA|nr:dehydrogenase/reductase SDR family protein member 10 [Gloeophyllum trabeum ATCC 11539]EPQ60067.1 dehydrogenase/reductase SDR family protein member 10 [Gloeophyllum trabeum ATCC 11539]